MNGKRIVDRSGSVLIFRLLVAFLASVPLLVLVINIAGQSLGPDPG